MIQFVCFDKYVCSIPPLDLSLASMVPHLLNQVGPQGHVLEAQ
jgi:hypothetical protein